MSRWSNPMVAVAMNLTVDPPRSCALHLVRVRTIMASAHLTSSFEILPPGR